MKAFLLIFCFSALMFSSLQAKEPDVKAAQDLYDQNEFRQAADLYQAVIDSGYVSAAVYFNMGNSFFKLNNIPRAILNYERALRLAPGDEAIRFNLELSRSMIYDRIETVPDMFLVVWLKDIRDLLSVRQWSWLSVVLFVLSLSAILLFFFMQMGRWRYVFFWVGAVCLMLSLGAFKGAFFQYRNVTSVNSAIIFTPTVTVKSAPGDGGTNLFILHEGTKVTIDDKVGEWIEIRIPNGTKGWLRNSDVEVI